MANVEDANMDSRERAKLRWNILKKTIIRKTSSGNFLNTAGSRSGVFRYVVNQECDADDIYKVTCAGSDITFQIRIPSANDRALNLEELVGFDNTGNLCIWSSEEAMLLFVISTKLLFEGKSVLEVGGGSTAMAGLWLSASGLCRDVTLTDGHPKCVAKIKKCVDLNAPLPTPTVVKQLKWEEQTSKDSSKEAETSRYDFVLAADCVFHMDTQSFLCSLLWRSVRPGGHVIAVAPHRIRSGGSSLDSFTKTMEVVGFIITKLTIADEEYLNNYNKICDNVIATDKPIIICFKRPLKKEES